MPDAKRNIRMSFPEECAREQPSFEPPIVRQAFIFWMNLLGPGCDYPKRYAGLACAAVPDLKKTILLVTHDTDEAIYLSDRILILGAPGEGIRKKISIKEPSRSREWLYEQGSLRAKIHRIIKEKK